MPRHSPALAGALITTISCALVAVLVVSALALDATQTRYLFIAVVALLALGVCFAVPVESLPTFALLAVVLIPDRIADYSTSPVLTPATALLVVWILRKLLSGAAGGRPAPGAAGNPRAWRALTVTAVLLAVGMVPLVVVSPSKRFSIAWAFTFVVAVVAPLLVGDFEKEARGLRRALPWTASAVAVYAVLQSLAQQNFLYTPVYDALGLDELQHWAVYRSDASLGHPLTAGLFFAAALAFCTGRWLETSRPGFAVAALLNGLGIVTTVSRGSYISAAVAVSLVLVVALSMQRRHRVRRVLLLALFAGGGLLAVNTQAFVERGLSAEGLSSLNSRNALPEIAADTASAYHWLGGGPASSLPLAAPFNFQHLPIENSYLQILIDLGVWGLLLFVLLLVLAAVNALRRRNLSGLGALLGYATAISGYAALDSRRGLVVLLGLLIMMSFLRPEGGPARADPSITRSTRRTRRTRRTPTRVPSVGDVSGALAETSGCAGQPAAVDLVGATRGA